MKKFLLIALLIVGATTYAKQDPEAEGNLPDDINLEAPVKPNNDLPSSDDGNPVKPPYVLEAPVDINNDKDYIDNGLPIWTDGNAPEWGIEEGEGEINNELPAWNPEDVIPGIEEDIKDINDKIDNANDKINYVNDRLSDTRKEMKGIGAQSAAMTAAAVSATQSLEVGEVGIGIGHGSYADKSAQSFSVGMRPTENLNVNASWSHAKSNSDMLSVGAGYKLKIKK